MGRKTCSARRQVSCLAWVWQAAGVQAWEDPGIGLECRQPPGRPSWEALRFSRPPPPSLSRKPARAQPAAHPQVGADQECGSWPRRAWLPTLLQSRTPSTRVHHMEKWGVHLRAKPGAGGGRLGYTPSQGRGAAPLQALPWVTASGPGHTLQLDSPGPTGRMGTEASFLPMLCL